MRIAYFCFIVAAAAGFAGMSLGIYMGLNQDFALAPAHAHLNLLGWVTMSLYGLYHRGVARRDARLAWAQVGSGALGFALLTTAMAFMLGGGVAAFLPVAIVGAVLCVIAMALFIAILIGDARRLAAAPFAAPNRLVLAE